METDNKNANNIQDQKDMETGDWLVLVLMGIIPVIGTAILAVWAFGPKNTKLEINRAKYALVLFIIHIVIFFFSVFSFPFRFFRFRIPFFGFRHFWH